MTQTHQTNSFESLQIAHYLELFPTSLNLLCNILIAKIRIRAQTRALGDLCLYFRYFQQLYSNELLIQLPLPVKQGATFVNRLLSPLETQCFDHSIGISILYNKEIRRSVSELNPIARFDPFSQFALAFELRPTWCDEDNNERYINLKIKYRKLIPDIYIQQLVYLYFMLM